MNDRLLEMDEIHARRMEKASDAFVTALSGGSGPMTFLWQTNHSRATKQVGEVPCFQLQGMAERLRLIAEKDAEADRLKVSRDPCTWCGTRADLGCKHRRVG